MWIAVPPCTGPHAGLLAGTAGQQVAYSATSEYERPDDLDLAPADAAEYGQTFAALAGDQAAYAAPNPGERPRLRASTAAAGAAAGRCTYRRANNQQCKESAGAGATTCAKHTCPSPGCGRTKASTSSSCDQCAAGGASVSEPEYANRPRRDTSRRNEKLGRRLVPRGRIRR